MTKHLHTSTGVAALAAARAVGAIERKDANGGNAGDDQVLGEITREIKSLGEDLKAKNDSMRRDLEAVRKIAEDNKGSADHPEIKAQIDALTKSVTEKHANIEEQVKGLTSQFDELDTAFQRSPSGSPESQAELKADAEQFFRTKAALAGSKEFSDPHNMPDIDIEAYQDWSGKTFGIYLRSKDDREVEAKALAAGSGPDGGYLVPTARSARIIEKVRESSPLRRLATVETIGTGELELPLDQDDVGSGWVGEEEARPETSTPTVGVQKIPVHEIYAKPKATQQLLEDSSMNIESWLAGKIADRFSRVEATGFVNGNGVKKPRGILSYPNGTARGTIEQINSGHATQITADAIVKLPFQLMSAYLANAQWLMKRTTVADVMLLKDAQNQYLWRPGLVSGQPSTLGSYAVEMADDMPAVAANALSIAFGNFRRGYTVVDRLGITVLRDPYSAKPFVEFYSRKRVGGDVVDFDAFKILKIAA